MFAQQWRAEWDTSHISAKQPKVKGNEHVAATLCLIACLLLFMMLKGRSTFLQLITLLLRPGPESVLWLSQRLLLSLCIMTGSVYKCLQTEMGNTYAKYVFKMGTKEWGRISTFHYWQPKRRQHLISRTCEWVCVWGTMLKQVGVYDYLFIGNWRITVSFWHSLATDIFLTEA